MSHSLSDAPQNPDDAARTGADAQEPIDLRGQDDTAGTRTDADTDTTTEQRSAETTARERTSETTQLDGEELEAEEERRDERSDSDSDSAVASGEDAEDARAPGTRRASDELDDDSDDSDGADDGDGAEDEAEKQRRAEEFAREHDPADHDVTAGEQFRQRGDVVADDGRMKVVDGEGRYQDAGDADDIVEGIGAQVGGDGDESGSGDEQSASGHDEGQPASDQGSDGEAGAFGGEEQAHVSPHGEPGASDSSQSDLSASEAAEKDGRRVSSYEEVQDGGYGVGSAATLEDRAMPLDHPVKAWQDTMTYVAPGHGRYDDAEPHVWFYDTDAAERAGFRSAGD